HSVALSGVAANCSVAEANPQTVTVPAGGTVSTTFNISCTAPPTTGNLTVSTTTTGSNFPSSYTGTVDPGTVGEPSKPTTRNGSPPTVDVGPNFPGTGITAYRTSSSLCSDPTKGAEFDGILQVEGETNQYTFTVAACDNGPSGSGLDFFSINVPNAGYSKAG